MQILLRFQAHLDWYGVDLMGPTPTAAETDNQVNISEMALSEDQLHHLAETVNPLQQSDYYGMDLYDTAKLALSRQF